MCGFVVEVVGRWGWAMDNFETRDASLRSGSERFEGVQKSGGYYKYYGLA